jgi:glycosyltransferase involved in cell wall biosynthesis
VLGTNARDWSARESSKSDLMRVGIFCRRPPNSHGGVEYVVRSLAPKMSELAPDWDISVESAYARPGGFERLPGIGDILGSVKLGWRLVQAPYDLVFVQGAEYAWGVRLARWLSRRRTAIVVVWHGVGYIEALVCAPPGSVKARSYAQFRRIEQSFGLAADSLVVVHERVLHDMRRTYGSVAHVVVAPNAIRQTQGSTPLVKAEEGVFTVLWVGQVAYQKGLDIALGAAQLAHETVGSLVLVTVGLAERTQFPTFVRAIGRRSPREMREIFAMADVFLCPSRYEGFPIVLLEAMEAGLPIVASEAAAAGIVRDGRNGYLISEASTQSYAAALLKLWQSAETRADMSAANRLDVCEFNWDRTALRYILAGQAAIEATVRRIDS